MLYQVEIRALASKESILGSRAQTSKDLIPETKNACKNIVWKEASVEIAHLARKNRDTMNPTITMTI